MNEDNVHKTEKVWFQPSMKITTQDILSEANAICNNAAEVNGFLAYVVECLINNPRFREEYLSRLEKAKSAKTQTTKKG